MSLEHVGQAEIVRFAEAHVNLPSEKAKVYRAQARRLREKLQSYLSEHPDFALKKMLLSGSLAKRTALRSLNDIDIACYIGGVDTPSDIPALLEYLAERLRAAFPNFKPEQVQPSGYSVTVSFRGTGLDVDVVPILYDGDPDWYGRLVSQEDGSFLETCIPRHLEFALKRRKAYDGHFAQVVQLLKFWARKEKSERHDFKLKSFIVELVVSLLADRGQPMTDYIEAMQSFFTYVASTGLRERIVFEDYFSAASAPDFIEPIQILDPVNLKNNAARAYTLHHSRLLAEAAMEAGDAIDYACRATTKGETVSAWRRVLGSPFAA